MYANFENLEIGETASFLVSSVKSARAWRLEPMTIERTADGFRYTMADGLEHVAPVIPGVVNPGHRGLAEFCRTQTGVHLFEVITRADKVRRYYAKARRTQIARGPAIMDRGRAARGALAIARADLERKTDIYTNADIWRKSSAVGGPFKAFGESRMVWIEEPESVGLRYVGSPADLDPHARHTGWYLDDEQGETVQGAVYQLPGKDGRARYLAGYADPHQNGPACLSLDIIQGDALDSSWDTDSAKIDAARAADHIAERMAEETRNCNRAYHEGQQAREKMREACATGRDWLDTVRAIKTAYAERWQAVADNVPIASTREWIRAEIQNARDLCERYHELKETAVSALDDKPSAIYETAELDSWRDGYAS